MNYSYEDMRQKISAGSDADEMECFLDTRTLTYRKLDGLDREILKTISEYPLLSKNTVEDIFKKEVGERISSLYKAGILSRFSVVVPTCSNYIKNLYYLADDAYGMLNTVGTIGFPKYSIGNMSNPMRLEVAAISRWCVYTLIWKQLPGKGVSMIRYGMPDGDFPYLEAVIQKKIHTSWLKRNSVCRFHVLCLPKSRDRRSGFLEELLYFEYLTNREEQGMAEGTQKSNIIIVCENDDDMDRVALELCQLAGDKFNKKKGHILYSLEDDVLDEFGAFKFLRDISYRGGILVREQIIVK